MKDTIERIAVVASPGEDAQAAKAALEARYPVVAEEEADVLVALGGDGLMLRALHGHMDSNKPIYGMNRGSVGFLMNDYHEADLMERLNAAKHEIIHPLKMTATTVNGDNVEALAINEVSMLRQTHQAAKLEILIDGKVRMTSLICDGILVATPAGSTAYNLSAHGPIIPLKVPLLALTPISPFRPRRWRGALLPDEAIVTIHIINPDRRPVSVAADFHEFRDIATVEVKADKDRDLVMLFDGDGSLDERIIREQFHY